MSDEQDEQRELTAADVAAREAEYKALLAKASPAGAADTKTLLDEAQRAVCEAHIRAVKRVCRGELNPQHRRAAIQLIEAGRREEASAMDEAGRAGCGADFNDVVVAGPWDGVMHDYACPTCKKSGKYGAPTYEVDFANALLAAAQSAQASSNQS